jgi:hypothetical protein
VRNVFTVFSFQRTVRGRRAAISEAVRLLSSQTTEATVHSLSEMVGRAGGIGGILRV